MTEVLFGNDAPLMTVRNDDNTINYVPAEHMNQSETHTIMQPDFDDQEHVDRALSTNNDQLLSLIARSLSDDDRVYAIGISQIEQFWSLHSGNPKPSWVDSDDKKFAEALGRYYDVPVGQPQAMITNAGADLIHQAAFSTGAQPSAANYMALANNAAATNPTLTDTTLVGEITTPGGGLLRARATFTHTAGTNFSTLTKTFTANSSDSLPVTVSQIGILNAPTAGLGGTLAVKTPLGTNIPLSNSGDNATITETIAGGSG